MPVANSIQSVLNPAGPQAAAIAEIAWVLFVGGLVIFAAVLALTAYAVIGARRTWLTRRVVIVGGGIVFPVVVLSALLAYTVLAGPKIAAATGAQLAIEVTGKQWWWEIRYLDAAGRTDFVTANEIHVPVGTTVAIALHSADVLHSFWVPALAGKVDMIPGKKNRLLITADRPGVYRGQCAEYCGGPHALMAFLVIAGTPEDFSDWTQSQRTNARTPQTESERQGAALALSHCASCHTMRGTAAAGRLGPDLTHFGSRRSIAAGMLPNDPATQARWISASQHIKPGNLMPSFDGFGEDDLAALTAYLQSLK